MGYWNNNDREESKPTWLNKIAKRLCTRTVRGWEMPLMGSLFGYGQTDAGDDIRGAIYTELLVAIPGAASRGSGGLDHALGGQGLTVSTDLPNYAPYFTCPFSGDGPTEGGIQSSGVSHSSFTYVLDAGITPGAGYGYQYGVNKYGVSSLGGLTGVTAYIKVCANDANFTNTLSIGLSGTHTQFTLYTGESLKSTANVPARVFNTFFGATSTDDKVTSYRYDNIGVLVAAGTTANGNKTIRLKVNDGPAGVTAYTQFKLSFDRPAGITTPDLSTFTIQDYTYYNYDNTF